MCGQAVAIAEQLQEEVSLLQYQLKEAKRKEVDLVADMEQANLQLRETEKLHALELEGLAKHLEQVCGCLLLVLVGKAP